MHDHRLHNLFCEFTLPWEPKDNQFIKSIGSCESLWQIWGNSLRMFLRYFVNNWTKGQTTENIMPPGYSCRQCGGIKSPQQLIWVMWQSCHSSFLSSHILQILLGEHNTKVLAQLGLWLKVLCKDLPIPPRQMWEAFHLGASIWLCLH